MNRRQSLVLFALVLLLGGVSAWLQFGLLAGTEREISAATAATVEPDYYIENFTSTGMARSGKKYRVIARRLVHYPGATEALLEQPHIIQYAAAPDGAPRHIYADSGQLYDDRAEVLLSGNVKVVENDTGDLGGDLSGAVVTSKKMLIRLKDDS